MIEKRLTPALKEGTLSRSDMISVLREVEEYSRQNIFLYSTSKTHAGLLVNVNYVRQQLKKIDREDLLDSPPILDLANDLTLSDVRIEGNGDNAALVIKAVEGRSYREYLGEDIEGNLINRRYRVVEERAVDVLRVQHGGFVELRIQSHRNTSDYVEDINKMWSLCNPLVEAVKFNRSSVSKVKEYLWVERKKLKHKIRFADSRYRNAAGSVMTLATGSEQKSLYDDEGGTASVDTFVKHEGSYDRSDVFWLKGSGGTVPSRELHTILDGAINQLAVTMSCTKPDFDWVLSEIRKFNEA